MRHEAEVDTRIAETFEAYVRAQIITQRAGDSARHAAGFKQVYEYHQPPRWNGTVLEALEALDAKGDEYLVSWGNHANKIVDSYHAAEDAESAAYAVYTQAEDEYEGWSRFFLVVDGHIHSTRQCSTCYVTTRFGWLPELSGLTEADAVEAYGAVLCSVCYPSAPVEYVGGKSDGLTVAERAARKAERDAEKAAKDAEKAAKAITDVDGSPLRVDGDTLRTKVAARNALTQTIQYAVFYGLDRYEGHIRHLAAALDAAGVDWRTSGAKAVKRNVKDGGDHGAAVQALLDGLAF